MEKIRKCAPTQQETEIPPNFLEVCFLCAIVHYTRSNSFQTSSYDVSDMYVLYLSIIDALQSLGIYLPAAKLTKDIIIKKLNNIKKKI